ncbi:MAG: hypothetical protein IIC78_14475 [Chloroflexi bacterium]|nr:hypothetical protein [Chloroflexota bacterium]
MSAYDLNRLMFEVHHQDDLAAKFREDPDDLFKHFDLTESEREALQSVDQIRILKLGGHSLLTLFFVRKNGTLTDFDHAVTHDVEGLELRYG